MQYQADKTSYENGINVPSCSNVSSMNDLCRCFYTLGRMSLFMFIPAARLEYEASTLKIPV